MTPTERAEKIFSQLQLASTHEKCCLDLISAQIEEAVREGIAEHYPNVIELGETGSYRRGQAEAYAAATNMILHGKPARVTRSYLARQLRARASEVLNKAGNSGEGK